MEKYEKGLRSMNKFVNSVSDLKKTENGATAYSTTRSAVYDMFALGGAYRQRSAEDCVELFKKAFAEDRLLAMKCLFYLRDIRGGQGERRFVREILKYLANEEPDTVMQNIELIPEFGRWDDLYSLYGTLCWFAAEALMHKQFRLDIDSKTPSLLGKWLKSENASSKNTKLLARATRKAFGLTPKQYRLSLSSLREKIKVTEKLMSENRWDEIEFDKIPSKAGLIYKNAFARRDIIRKKYESFANDKNTKVNAEALYPYEIIRKAIESNKYSETQANMIQKYWDNLPDYTGDGESNILVMADVSGSMTIGGNKSVKPLDVSVSLALYFAEKQKGPFKDLFMTFTANPDFVTVEGSNIIEKIYSIIRAYWGWNTDLVKAFSEILKVATENNVPQEDMPKTLMVVSDMEIDQATFRFKKEYENEPEMNIVHRMFEQAGYETPHLIYWNVNARNDTILDRSDGVTCVSGCSPVIFESVLSGKTGYDLMLEKLNSERYSAVTA